MSPSFRLHTPRFAALSVSLLASTVILGACEDDPIQSSDPIEWQAELAGAGDYADVEGLATVSSDDNSFEASIEIAGAAADAVFTWQVAAGTCATPGARVGGADRYPDLEAEADGTAAAEADVTAALDEEGDYIVRILDESGEETETVACAVLAVEA